MTTPLPESTLREAFARERPYRPHWPEHWEVARRDPLIMATLDILARHVPAFGRRKQDRLAVGAYQPSQSPQSASIPDSTQQTMIPLEPCQCPDACLAGQGAAIPKGMRCRRGSSYAGTYTAPCRFCAGYGLSDSTGEVCAACKGTGTIRQVLPQARPPVLKRQPGIDFKSRAAGEKEDSD